MKNRNITGYLVPKAVVNYIDERNYFGWKLRGERAVRFAGIKNGDAVLDLCCGPGMVTKVISNAVGSGGKVVGIDISKDFIDYANKFCNKGNVSFITGNVEKLDEIIEKQKFDAAIILASWFWIKEKNKLCAQVKKLLKPVGRFVISISSDNLNDAKTRKFYWVYRKKLKDVVLETYPLTDLSYFDKLPVLDDGFVNETKLLINGSGFKLKSQHEVERVLTLKDKLFTYNNPARTEWVGKFPPHKRLSIIKRAFKKTVDEIDDLSVIKRHTYYLVFVPCRKIK